MPSRLMTVNSDPDGQKFDGEESLISKRELAWRLGKSERTIDNWRRHHGLPCFKVSRSVLFRYSEVIRHLEKIAKSLTDGWEPPQTPASG